MTQCVLDTLPNKITTFKKGVSVIVQCGRQISHEEFLLICETVKVFSQLSRKELVHTICEHLKWYTASGKNKFEACQKLLQRLEAEGHLQLPEKVKTKKWKDSTIREQPISTDRTRPQKKVTGKLSDIGPVSLKMAKTKEDISLVNEYFHRYHYLGYKKPFGCHLRYLIMAQDSILGCMLFSGAAKALKQRDQWIGWSSHERLRNLGFVVNNGRFLLFPWVNVKFLASHVLSKAVKILGEDWQQRWSYRPALMETFVDPQHFAGTCYQAANFEYLGTTTGMGLVRQGKSYTTSPKKIFAYPLVDNFRQVLCSGLGEVSNE